MYREVQYEQNRIDDMIARAKEQQILREAGINRPHPLKNARIALERGLIAIGKQLSDD